MGISNLKIGLERYYCDWLGEKVELEKQIAEIEAAYCTLEEKRGRIEQVERLTQSAAVILSELNPKWDAAKMKPTKKWATKLPYDSGEVTRMAFDIMRREDRPMRSSEIAKQLVTEKGDDVDDHDLVTRVKAAIDSSLRSKVGTFVEITRGGYAREYSVIKGKAHPGAQ